MNEKCCASIHARLQQSHALFSRAPGLHHYKVQLVAQKLVDHALVLAAHFKEVRQRAHRRQPLGQHARLQQPAHCVGGVAVVPNQRLQRIAPARGRSLLAAQLVGLRVQGVLFRAPRLQALAQLRNFTLQPRQRFSGGLKPQPRLPAFHANALLLALGLRHLSFKPLGLALQRRQALLGLRGRVARVAGLGQQLHHMPPRGLQLALGSENLFARRTRLLLLRLHLLAEGRCLASRCLQKSLLLRALFGNARQLCLGLLQLACRCRDARLQLGHTLGIRTLPRRCTLQLHGGRVGLILRALHLVLQRVAALVQRVLAGLRRFNLRGRALNLLAQRRNLRLQPRLLGIHGCHAAGQHHAQLAPQLLAHRGKALGLRRLPLQAVHLPRHFFKNVFHARQVLLGAFQAQLCQPLLGLEARNARGLFDNGAPVVRLRAQQLPNALLPDDRVALRPKASAHEDVLNVAQAAQLAVQQIFALAGAEQPPRDDNFALLRRAVELAAANLQHHLRPSGLRIGRHWLGGLRLLRASLGLIFNGHSRLLGGDNLLGLAGSSLAQLALVPVRGRLVVNRHLRLHGNRPLVGLRVHHGQRHFRHAQRLAFARAGKNHVLHVAAAQSLRALLAQHPAHAVQNVRLSAPVGPHHNCHARSRHRQFRAVAKALESQDVDLLQFQHFVSGGKTGPRPVGRGRKTQPHVPVRRGRKVVAFIQTLRSVESRVNGCLCG